MKRLRICVRRKPPHFILRRFPQCAWSQIECWLAQQKARLLACEHDHAIVTIPHELNDLWVANVEVMSGLLLARVPETLLTLLGKARYLGARPGILSPATAIDPGMLVGFLTGLPGFPACQQPIHAHLAHRGDGE
jgi:hypothetical protein